VPPDYTPRFCWSGMREDDAERAIRCGLELLGRVRQLNGASSELDARIGIATGLVVVGELVGTGDNQEHGVVGETATERASSIRSSPLRPMLRRAIQIGTARRRCFR